MNSTKLSSSKNILTVGFIGLLMALGAFSFSLWQTPNYKSTVKLLAVFNQSNIDTYTASKTANYITGILGEVVYSDSFINSVFAIDSKLIDNLGQGSEKRQRAWQKAVKTKVLDNKGVVVIDVYGQDKNQTKELATAIGLTIVSQHGLYDGSQDRVIIKMIDTPSIYEKWSDMKIIGDAGLGLVAGLLIGFTLIVIFPNHKLFEFKRKNYALLNFPAMPDRKFRAPAAQTAAPTIPAAEINDSGHQPPAPDEQADQVAGKSSNPWLDQYYEENLNEYQDRNS